MADQAYGSYVDLALIQQQGSDGVLRKHHARRTDFRRGRKNGIGDHQVEWQKPTRRPAHMSEEEFAAIPDTLMVREVCLRRSRQGFRDQSIIVVTTNHGCSTLHSQEIDPSVWLALASGVQSICVISKPP